MRDAIEEYLETCEPEMRELEEMILAFENTLIDPSTQDHICEFHFGCTSDGIVWDDSWLTPTNSWNPIITECIDVEEMSRGVYDHITPEGLYNLMFGKRCSSSVRESLVLALRCERECESAGEATELQTETIQQHLRAVRDVVYESFRAEMASDPDQQRRAPAT